jgi:hypothetical protein
VSRIIVLSEQFRREELLTAMEAGADGYLIKNEVTPETLVQTLELVLLGAMVIPQGFGRLKGQAALEEDRLALPQAVPEGIQPHLGNCVEPPAGFSRLSEREQMVLTQIMRGASIAFPNTDEKQEGPGAAMGSPGSVVGADDVVRYLRQRNDVVVRTGDGTYLVNGRFRETLEVLVERANRIRTRQRLPLFVLLPREAIATGRCADISSGPVLVKERVV